MKTTQKTQTCHAEFISASNIQTLNQVQGDTIVNNHSTVQLFNRSTKEQTLKQVQGDTIVNNCSTVQLFNHSTKEQTLKQVQGDKRAAFTLAEVLITITIIGVVAAMTIPNLIADYEVRQYKTQATNFQRKLGEALRVMNAQNNLRGFDNTKEFVTELSKNFKITKVCDNVTDCFVKTIKKKNGDTIDVSTLTTSESLGHGEFGTNTVGVQFGNGITGIIAYNKTFSKSNDSDVVKLTESTDGKLKTVTLSTGVLSIVYDVSGYDKPNTNGEDIFSINSNIGGTTGCVQVGTYCITDLGTDYKPLACTEGVANGANKDYCGNAPSGGTADYWAGAQKACEDIGMKLPTLTILRNIYGYGTTDEYNGLVPSSGYYWSSTPTEEAPKSCSRGLNFKNGDGGAYLRNDGARTTKNNVLCIKN